MSWFGSVPPSTVRNVTVGSIAALLVGAFALLTPSERAASFGFTAHGQLLTAQDAGAPDAVGAVAVSPGTAGQVLTVGDAGLPVWRAASSGGPTFGAGTFAARPATCTIGDGYRVTSGARLGSVYECRSADTWALTRIDWLAVIGVAPMLAFDPEDLLGCVAGGTLTTWDERVHGAHAGILAAPGGTIACLSGAASWGGLAAGEWNDATTSPRLRSTVPGPLSSAARSLVVVVSSVSSTGNQIAAGWGSATSGGAAWNLGVRMSSGAVTGLECFAACGAGSGATPTSDTPTVLVGTYSGAAYALHQATITDGVPSWTESIASTAATLATGQRDADGPLTIGGYSSLATTWPLKGRVHGVLVFSFALSSDERDDLVNGLYARWQ